MNDKPKVLILTEWYPRKTDPWNGIFIQNWIKERSKYWDITVVAWLMNQDRFDINEKSNLEFKEIIIETKGGLIQSIFQFFKASRKVQINNTEYSKLILFPLPWTWIMKLMMRVNLDVQLIEHQSGYHPLHWQKIPFWAKWIYQHALRNISKIAVVSPALKKHIETKTHAKIEVIPNQVSINQLKHNHTINPKPTLAIIGDVRDSIKGISPALEVLAKYQDIIHVQIIGDGADVNNLNQTYPWVQFLPALNHSELLIRLTQLDGVINNAPFETFSILASEAQQIGCPLICRRNEGPEFYSGPFVYFYSEMAEMEEMIEHWFHNVTRGIFPKPFFHADLNDQKINEQWNQWL